MKNHRLLQVLVVIGVIALNVGAFHFVKEKRQDDYNAQLKKAWMGERLEKAVARSENIYNFEVDGEGELVSQVPAVICDDIYEEDAILSAELVDLEMPKKLSENEFVRAKVTLKNTGDVIWYGSSHPCSEQYPLMQLGNAETLDEIHSLWNDFNFVENNWSHNEFKNRINLTEKSVAPGEEGTFSFWLETPITDVTNEVNIVKDEKAGKEKKDVKRYKWAYEKYTFSPVVGKEWMETDIPVTLKLGKLPPKEAEKLKFLNAKRGTYKLKDFSGEKNIYMRLSDQTGFMRYGENAFHSYKISSGAWDTKTPVGDHRIYNKQELRIGGAAPHYRMPYWMGLNINGAPFTGYGLHEVPYLGLSRETSEFYENGLKYDLGKNVSHGCVRSSDKDAPFIYSFGEVGMNVYVRNADDSKIFATMDPPVTS